MTHLGDFGGAAAFFGALAVKMGHGHRKALEKSARIVEAEVKSAIGTYRYGWPALAESTQAERARAGYAPNDPLRRSGDYANTISHNTAEDHADIGTNDRRGAWFENGTSKMPARPHFYPAAIRKAPEVVETIGRDVVATLTKG